jgi:hypothetical protein
MAKFPTYERRQGLGGGTTASYASDGAFAAPGRAMQGLGDAVSSAGDAWAAQLKKTKDSQDDTWFSRARAETAMELQQYNEEQKKAATGDAAGYQEAVKSRFAEVRQRHLGEAPSPRAQQMYDEWSFTYSANVDSTTGTFRAASELAKRNDDFAAAMLAHTQTVFADPTTYEDVKRRVLDDMEGAKQWMTPEQELEVRSKMDRELDLAKAKGDIVRDPKAFLERTGLTATPGKVNIRFGAGIDAEIETAAARHGVSADALRVIAQIESSGNPNAKNPNSSAGGLFQFTDGTARQYGLTDKYDPAAASDAAARLMRDNAAALRSALGREPTIGELYLAHQQGAGGAVKLLSNPGRQAVDVVGWDEVRLNGGGPGMTAQQFANIWISKAEKIAGGAGGPSPDFSHPEFRNLSPDDVLALGEEAQQRIAASDRAAKAQYDAAAAQVKGAFQLGIATGDPGVTQQAILASPLADDDKATLINSLNEKRKDQFLATEFLEKIGAGAMVDPYDTKSKKGIGLAYDTMVGGGNIYDEDAKARAIASYVYGRTGVLPGAASNQIRSGLFGGDPARAAVAGALAAELAALRGDAMLGEQEGGKDIAEAAQAWRHATERLGMSPEDAGQYMVDLRDPEKMAQRKAFMESEYAKELIKDIDDSTVRALFGSSAPMRLYGAVTGQSDVYAPDFPSEAGQAIATEEYREIYKQSLFETAGDKELAKDRADLRFKRMYGVGETPSGHYIMKNAPSVLLPPDDKGSHDWTKTQLMDELRRDGVAASEVLLIPSQDTDVARREGQEHIPFDVWYKDEAGTWQAYPGMFVPDRETRNQQIDEDLRKGVEAAERERERRKAEAERAKVREKAVDEVIKDDTQQDWQKAREIERLMELERLENDRVRIEEESAVKAKEAEKDRPTRPRPDPIDQSVMRELGEMQPEVGKSYRIFKTEDEAWKARADRSLSPGQDVIISPDGKFDLKKKYRILRFEREFEGSDPLSVSP